ncbi:hypothetical protein [Simiduia agarivorans]|uniref:Uncharacterized protein n=2 Tax=Simiduia TaxID=447467 RepID=R9S385_SIMAS|nr:hypothetical protein [Simiduia agarivorans]AGN11267.1 hypothetical protein M5M_00917 [Simiduia agarivorans SA1 = DSM 21679]
MAPAFLAGHVGAMLFTLLWSSAEENLKKEREQAAKRNNPYPD